MSAAGHDHFSAAGDRHRPPRVRDFAGQLARMRLVLLLVTLAWTAGVLWQVRVVLEQTDATAATLSAVMTVAVAVVGVVALTPMWRLWSRQRPLATACQTLRDAARAIPAGSAGVWDSALTDTSVLGLVRPDGTVSFSLAQEEDLQVLDRAAEGETHHLISTEIQVLGQAPVAWRLVHADRAAADDTVDDVHPEPPARRSLTSMAKLVLMQHRTGVLTPSPDELETLIRRVTETEPVIIPGDRR